MDTLPEAKDLELELRLFSQKQRVGLETPRSGEIWAMDLRWIVTSPTAFALIRLSSDWTCSLLVRGLKCLVFFAQVFFEFIYNYSFIAHLPALSSDFNFSEYFPI